MFTQQDDLFVENAANPVRRSIAIADVTGRRRLALWGAYGITFATIVCGFTRQPFVGLLAFVTAIQWMLVFKCESELRLLRVIDRLHR